MLRNSTNVSTKQERIAALAKQSPLMAFTSLAHLMDIDWLKKAYRRTRKDGAAGVDGVTADEYEQDLGPYRKSFQESGLSPASKQSDPLASCKPPRLAHSADHSPPIRIAQSTHQRPDPSSCQASRPLPASTAVPSRPVESLHAV
jgi:hypothetical protein